MFFYYFGFYAPNLDTIPWDNCCCQRCTLMAFGTQSKIGLPEFTDTAYTVNLHLCVWISCTINSGSLEIWSQHQKKTQAFTLTLRPNEKRYRQAMLSWKQTLWNLIRFYTLCKTDNVGCTDYHGFLYFFKLHKIGTIKIDTWYLSSPSSGKWYNHIKRSYLRSDGINLNSILWCTKDQRLQLAD